MMARLAREKLEGEAARLAALRDRLELYRRDRCLAERMGAAGRRLVLDRFRWEDVVDRCLAIYRGDA